MACCAATFEMDALHNVGFLAAPQADPEMYRLAVPAARKFERRCEGQGLSGMDLPSFGPICFGVSLAASSGSTVIQMGRAETQMQCDT